MVVYDQSTKDASLLSKDSFVYILLSKLEHTFSQVSLLTGKPQASLAMEQQRKWNQILATLI